MAYVDGETESEVIKAGDSPEAGGWMSGEHLSTGNCICCAQVAPGSTRDYSSQKDNIKTVSD